MEAAQDSFDFLLNTIPVGHDIDPYMALLKRDGTMVLVGAVEPLTSVNGIPFVLRRRSVAGSVIGGMPETQEMLDFCGEHDIACEIETIGIQDMNKAYERPSRASAIPVCHRHGVSQSVKPAGCGGRIRSIRRPARRNAYFRTGL